MTITTPASREEDERPSTSKQRSNLSPAPDSSTDDEEEEDTHIILETTSRNLKKLERQIETDEWKVNAMKINIFTGSGIRNALKHTRISYGSISLQPGKRLRLK
eukprot:CAMPEP_0183717706 /NCGR_PEP_ID=MMETSP0737-20130205/11237_1 /TAXON_ID=385413 /ORGANISM="Thalassiosira miniscula, Strain CCMP1093" /LENGTH=103 /DNA_ID=CAMNT_0025947183 /DNA_START=274 /DNA_END=585 /DNA_ORIENTATION=-